MSASLELRAVRGIATVQDLGRPGHMHEGVPCGGALVPERLVAANLAVGNDANAAAIEFVGSLVLVVHGASRCVGTAEGVRVLEPGAPCEIVAPRDESVGYAAIEGGIDVPSVLDARATLLVASLGGHEGRRLCAGDRLALGAHATRVARPFAFDLSGPIRVTRGPDLARFEHTAFEHFVAATFEVSPASDRVGARMRGATVRRIDDDTAGSHPMVRGAIEVPASGEPIVLGPDHPTTGGYPVIAVVIRADWGRAGARRVGARMRFVEVTVEQARAAYRAHPLRTFTAAP